MIVRKNRWFIDARFFPFPGNKEAQAYLYESNLSVLGGGNAQPSDYLSLFEESTFLEDMKLLVAEDLLPPSLPNDMMNDIAEVAQSHFEPQPSDASDKSVVCPKCGKRFVP